VPRSSAAGTPRAAGTGARTGSRLGPGMRPVHRQVPFPPLRVGIACDVSGSMRDFAKPLSSAAWIMAQAVAWSAGESATVCFGESVTAITRPGASPARVREFRAGDATERFWLFQGIETALFVALAVLLLAAVHWVRRCIT